MARKAREKSKTGIYFIHINWNKNLKPFKDITSYNSALKHLYNSAKKYDCDVFAYSFDNSFVRFIIKENTYESCPKFIQSFLSAFSAEYNKKHQRRGALTKDRYISLPVDNGLNLAQTIFFIHSTSKNAEHTSISEYLIQSSYEICNIRNAFFSMGLNEEEFWNIDEDMYTLPKEFIKTYKRSNAELKKLIKDRYNISANRIVNLEKVKRDEILKELREKYYLTIKEIETLTGISKGIIASSSVNHREKNTSKQEEIWLL